jgi:hypothetical protein
MLSEGDQLFSNQCCLLKDILTSFADSTTLISKDPILKTLKQTEL